MKRLLTQISGVCALIFAMLFVHVEPGLAHGWLYRHHCNCHAHVAYYVEPVPTYGDLPCRVVANAALWARQAAMGRTGVGDFGSKPRPCRLPIA